eukprot:TRINITY_DN24188_c0_g1_i1.p2 TRINITY_DN24188_c0_g1~~TRINITY_DN24188_c0_g1_i1.p2  ORF type:complete len:242 (-),score=37.34 TRINITY_DN24188_c0_g1_i1:1018-1743(-)
MTNDRSFLGFFFDSADCTRQAACCRPASQRLERIFCQPSGEDDDGYKTAQLPSVSWLREENEDCLHIDGADLASPAGPLRWDEAAHRGFQPVPRSKEEEGGHQADKAVTRQADDSGKRLVAGGDLLHEPGGALPAAGGQLQLENVTRHYGLRMAEDSTCLHAAEGYGLGPGLQGAAVGRGGLVLRGCSSNKNSKNVGTPRDGRALSARGPGGLVLRGFRSDHLSETSEEQHARTSSGHTMS